MMNAHRLISRVLPPALVVTVLIGGWEAWVRLADVDPAVLAPPSRVATALIDTRGALAGHTATTLAETAVGLLIGAAVGVLIALLIASVPIARRAIEPLLVVVQTIPPIVLAPILVLSLGFGWAPRVVVVVLTVFFPVAVAATGALLGADRDRVDLVRSFGGTRLDVLRHITFPGAVPAIFDGMRVSAAYAVAAAAIAEQIGGARSGLGLYIARSQRSFRADQVLAGVVVIAVLSLVVYGLVSVCANRATPWHTRTAKEIA
jgi:ABC-type nitrate/sulfonate/bicarbonate transport system permease component